MGVSSGHGDCGDVVHRLYHFLDGELDDERRMTIQRHLDACLNCLEAFDFELELRQLVARKCRDRVPDGLRMRVAMAINHPLGPLDWPMGGIPPV